MTEYQLLEQPFATPLVSQVSALARDLFGEFDALEIAWRLGAMPNATVQLARANGDLVAFKVGYAVGRTRYFSWLGGVASAHRAQGIARTLLNRQHAWARTNGYSAIETGTTKDNRAMLHLNLSEGFEIIGTYTRDSLPRVILQKRLGAA